MKIRTVALAAVLASSSLAYLTYAQEPPAKVRKVTKTDAEWRKQLTKQQYLVTRQAGTEPAFSGSLTKNHAKGTYECVCCGSPLFSSRAKFESGTGWPSFFVPLAATSVDTSTDYKLGYARTEVLCNTCGAHLGHVFDDGPAPTGLRYCMNSAALKFAKDEPAEPASKAKDAKKEVEKPKEVEKANEVETPKSATPK